MNRWQISAVNRQRLADGRAVPHRRTAGEFLLKGFYLLFCYVFTVILGGVIFANSDAKHQPFVLLPLIGCNLALLYFLFRILQRRILFVRQYYRVFIATGLALLFSANLAFGFILRYEPVFDLGAIFTGASEWVTTGSFLDHRNPTSDTNYFFYFPNNLGGMTLLYLGFKIASWFGITDYYAVAMVMNALLETAAVLLTVLICKRLFGIEHSIMALFCVLLSPPFYFMAPVFYTDTLSMVFPVLIIYLYLRTFESSGRRFHALWAALLGLSCAVGMLVKFTVIIALIAVLLYHLCTKGAVSTLLLAAISGAVIAAVYLVFNAYFYTAHLDRAAASRLRVPYTHWIMMSLQGEGRYNQQDYEFTLSFEDPREKREAIMGRIAERIQSLGPQGLVELFYDKEIVVFGDGTYAQSDFLDDGPVNETALHAAVLYSGELYPVYKYVCSGVSFTLLLLMLLSAYGALLRGDTARENTLPLICLLGVALFFMLWEVTGRYATNFIPVIVIAAVSGMDILRKGLMVKSRESAMQA